MLTQIENNSAQEGVSQQELTSPDAQQYIEVKPVKVMTCMQRATSLVDHVTDCLYHQIVKGFQKMQRRRPMISPDQQKMDPKKKLMIHQAKIDIDQHKKMIRKFMRLNKKFRKARQQRSVEFFEISKKEQQQIQMRKMEERNKTIQLRKATIEEKLKEKEQMKKSIRRSILESNKKYQTITKIKPLYEQREQKFKNQFILPKLQEEKRILQKKKQEMRPMDINSILQHQKKYQEKISSDRINRSLTSRVLRIQNHYEPPKYVPKSFLISQAQQQFKKEQQKLKVQEIQVNQFRKKEFLKLLQERNKHQLYKIKEITAQNKSKKNISAFDLKSTKQRAKSELNRQETKKQGDQFMREIIMRNKRLKKKRQNITEASSQKAISQEHQKPKSQFEIQMIKEQKIQKYHKIRVRKIDEIVRNQHLDNRIKLDILDNQNDKINQMLKAQTKHQDGQTVSIYLSSIHTKMAILQVISPKKQQ